MCLTSRLHLANYLFKGQTLPTFSFTHLKAISFETWFNCATACSFIILAGWKLLCNDVKPTMELCSGSKVTLVAFFPQDFYCFYILVLSVNITFTFVSSVQTHRPRGYSSSWERRMMTSSTSHMTSSLSWTSCPSEKAVPLSGERQPGQSATERVKSMSETTGSKRNTSC